MDAASITGETAAIAEPPQIPVPTPISVRRSPGTPSCLPYNQAAPRQTARVPSMTGSDDTPTRAASPIESCAPSRTTEHCRTKVLAHFSPGARRARGLTAIAMDAPMTAPGTALPTSGTYSPTTVATAATASARVNPGRSPAPAARHRASPGSGPPCTEGSRRRAIPEAGPDAPLP